MTTDTTRATEIQRFSAGDLKPLAALIDSSRPCATFPWRRGAVRS